MNEENKEVKAALKTREKPKVEEGLPEVAEENKKNPLMLIIIVIIIAGIWGVHFLTESKNKTSSQQIDESFSIQQNQKNAVPISPLKEAKETPPDPQIIQARLDYMKQKQDELKQRLSAPLLVVNGNKGSSSGTVPGKQASTSDQNTQFLNQVSTQSTDTVKAQTVGNRGYVITQGTLIHAVLETAINSDLPGYLRASVSDPIYSDDGSRVLIDRGSRLIGQYKSGMVPGQSRVYVVWTRVITPDGISLNLGSPGVSNLGLSGTGADSIDHHFFQQFGSAILLSIIGAGASNVGVSSSDQYNASQAYRTSIADSLAQTADQSIKQQGVIPPTIHINQGRPIMVFVAHDLDFEQAMKKTNANKLNIF